MRASDFSSATLSGRRGIPSPETARLVRTVPDKNFTEGFSAVDSAPDDMGVSSGEILANAINGSNFNASLRAAGRRRRRRELPAAGNRSLSHRAHHCGQFKKCVTRAAGRGPSVEDTTNSTLRGNGPGSLSLHLNPPSYVKWVIVLAVKRTNS